MTPNLCQRRALQARDTLHRESRDRVLIAAQRVRQADAAARAARNARPSRQPSIAGDMAGVLVVLAMVGLSLVLIFH